MNPANHKLSEQDAEEIARKHLGSLKLTPQLVDRSVKITQRFGKFTVAFNPPPGVRGGAFTVTIGKSGEVLAQRFER